MITGFLISMSCGIIAGFLSLMPGLTFDTSSWAATARSLGGLAGLNGYFPVITLGACLAVVIGVKLYMSVYRLVIFVYHQFWGSE